MFQPRPDHPYRDAARLPDQPEVRLDDVLGASDGPLELEIGPGRGAFLEERAAAAPSSRIVGLEIRLKYAKLVDDKLRARGLGERVRCFNGDAREVLPRLRPDGCLSMVFFHFPDPWWKKRHEKRLVLVDGTLAECARLLAPGGHVFVQTDVEERAAQYEEALAQTPGLAPAGDHPGSARLAENPYGARSNREHNAIRDGLPVYRVRFVRVAER